MQNQLDLTKLTDDELYQLLKSAKIERSRRAESVHGNRIPGLLLSGFTMQRIDDDTKIELINIISKVGTIEKFAIKAFDRKPIVFIDMSSQDEAYKARRLLSGLKFQNQFIQCSFVK